MSGVPPLAIMKIQINQQSALVTFTSETLRDARDLGALSQILKNVKAVANNNNVELECHVSQLLEALLYQK